MYIGDESYSNEGRKATNSQEHALSYIQPGFVAEKQNTWNFWVARTLWQRLNSAGSTFWRDPR